MDYNRNSLNSDYYAKCLRDKVKRDNKFTKLQNKILHQQKQREQQIYRQQQIQQMREKLQQKQKQNARRSDLDKRRNEKLANRQRDGVINGNMKDNDLLREIDKSLVLAKGFLLEEGN